MIRFEVRRAPDVPWRRRLGVYDLVEKRFVRGSGLLIYRTTSRQRAEALAARLNGSQGWAGIGPGAGGKARQRGA